MRRYLVYSLMAFKVWQLVNGLAMLSNTAANGHTGYWARVTWLIRTGMCCSVKYLLHFKDVGTCLVIQWLKTSCQCGSHEFDPWSRKIPHATTEQLSLCTTATEACAPQEKPLQWEACSPQRTVAPLSTTRESPQQWRLSAVKNKYRKIILKDICTLIK